jgi:toxin-antitoxin system PIN domain toxin
MSVTVDANVLVYASNSADPNHRSSRELLERLAAGPELVYLFWPTTMAYLRIVTHPGILPRPLTPTTAIANIDGLLDRAHVRAPGETEGFWGVFGSAADEQVRGNLVPDAHLVALMRQHGVRVIYTRDRDFRRFDFIESREPAPARSGPARSARRPS